MSPLPLFRGKNYHTSDRCLCTESCCLVAGPKTDAWMTPAQTMYLQQQTDELMWRSADAVSLRGQQSDPSSSTAEASTPPSKLEQPGMLRAKSEAAPQLSSLHAASSGLGSSGLGSELDKGRPTEAQSEAVDLAQVTFALVATRQNC